MKIQRQREAFAYRIEQRTAMPVPRTVPRNRENWEKTYDKLNDKAKKNGLGVELVPNFQMDVKDFEDQAFDLQWDWRGLRGGRSSWYSTPIEYEGKGVPGIGYQRKVLNDGSEGREIPIDYLIHHGDDGRINGILSHFPEGTPFEKPGSITVTVHPAHREKGIGGKLVQEAEKRFGLKLDEQQFTPLGYEMYRRLKHERGQDVPNIFNERTSAELMQHAPMCGCEPGTHYTKCPGGPFKLTQDTIDRLENEFNEWWDGTGRDPEDINYMRDLFTHDGPISDWPTIEEFLAERYPAAGREDVHMGWEDAHPLLERSLHPQPDDEEEYAFGNDPYETGPQAVAQHGYDPAEVIAGMLYLHNKSHPFRTQLRDSDRQRIMDVVDARRKMQKAYEKRQKAGAIGEDLYVNGQIKRLADQFDQWWQDYEPQFSKEHGFTWGDYENQTGDLRGPIGHWPHVETFLKENYPAAHKGFHMGHEQAEPLIEEYSGTKAAPYETGPEAVEKYGYDPKEIAATMLMLHSKTHMGRAQWAEWMQADLDRIYDVYRKRQQMERNRPKMQKVFDEMDAIPAFDLNNISDDDLDRLEQHDPELAGNIRKKRQPVTAAKGMGHNRLLKKLQKEFDAWAVDNAQEHEGVFGDQFNRGPIGEWWNVENFLADHYPAAHRGLDYGWEEAGSLLDSDADDDNSVWLFNHPEPFSPYETGPHAVAQHGYDPKEVAAAMLLLHNRSHPNRSDLEQGDTDRLAEIARIRTKMEKARVATTLTADDVIDRIGGEFYEWAKDNGKTNPYDERRRESGDTNPKFMRGAIGYWPHIESFLKERYPAAHRGLTYGFEDAMPLLDNEREREPLSWLDGKEDYETGHEAEQKYGYDPKEVVSALLLLHNETHHGRDNYLRRDMNRLLDIAMKRHKMQQAYEKAQAKYDQDWKVASINDDLLNRLKVEFKAWHRKQPKAKSFFSDDGGIFGGIDRWPNVEKFLKDQYPAAHRGLEYGLEDAGALLDGNETWHDYADLKPYETGPEAEAQHGYDPREIAAAMLLLHNKSDKFRDESEDDEQRLFDIAQKRFQMQRRYEERQKVGAAPSNKLSEDLLKKLKQEFDRWTENQSEHHHITNWPSIEGFLLDNYPAAHRGFEMGLEEARPLLRGEPNTLHIDYPQWFENYPGKQDYDNIDPYETGPEAVAKHGYDPHHVAAGMVYLHNKANGVIQDRDREIAEDVDFLHGLFKIRTKMQRQHDKRKELVNASRKIAFNQDLVDRLNDEFHSWYDKDGLNALAGNDPNMDFVNSRNKGNPAIREVMKMFVEEGRKAEVDGRGPIGYWPNIENFLKAKYPAAHKNFGAGMEQAGPHIDNFDGTGLGAPYESGPEAVAKHGYDPAEVAAAFVLLHNKSHPLRGRLEATDRDRLLKIFKVRERMQRQYEERLKKDLVTASIDYDDTPYWADAWDDEDDDDELPRHKRAAFDRMWYNIFLRRLAAGEEQAWKEEINRLAQQGIPIDLIKKLHENWVLTKKPINPDTGQPHTPQSARGSWVSGWVPFLEQYFPDSSTQRHMFDAVQGHNRAVDDVIRDLISDNGNPDRLTAGAMALHSMENGNFGLYQKILRMDPDLKRRTQEIADARSKGYHVDISTGLMTKPAPPTDFRKNIPPNLRSQPGEPTWMKNRKKQQQQQLPADTTPKPQGIPV